MPNLVATAEIDVDAPPETVWDALTDPAQIKKYMFGSVVETDWTPGSAISWRGEYDGKEYEDKGEIVQVERPRRLVLTHFSAMSGQEDRPENYHTLTYELVSQDQGTHISLSQDHNSSQEEADHSRENWATMLSGLKEVVEQG